MHSCGVSVAGVISIPYLRRHWSIGVKFCTRLLKIVCQLHAKWHNSRPIAARLGRTIRFATYFIRFVIDLTVLCASEDFVCPRRYLHNDYRDLLSKSHDQSLAKSRDVIEIRWSVVNLWYREEIAGVYCLVVWCPIFAEKRLALAKKVESNTQKAFKILNCMHQRHHTKSSISLSFHHTKSRNRASYTT